MCLQWIEVVRAELYMLFKMSRMANSVEEFGGGMRILVKRNEGI